MENKVINQKEYLRKYMSLGDSDDKKKKKKKKLKVGAKTVKIIDDDIDLKNMRPIKEGEFDILLNGEDAPQIAGIVDERGPLDFSDKRRWKIITENEEGHITITSHIIDTEKRNQDHNATANQNEDSDADLSSPRHKKSKDKHLDVHRHGRAKNNNSESSLPKRSMNYDSDLSSPRQSRNNDSDLSPPRQSRNSDSDLSPPRQSKNYDSDLSPPRKSNRQSSVHGTSRRNCRNSNNRDSDSDLSLPRNHKNRTESYESRRIKRNSDADLNIFRRKEHRIRKDESPHSSSRKIDRGYDKSDRNSFRSNRRDLSRSNKNKRQREYEDHHRKFRSYSDANEKRKRSRWDRETDNSEHRHAEHSKDRDGRMTKTLDGKTAGLQDAKALREETEAYKRREAEQFSKLSKTVSGVGQAPIVRDKTGRKRNLEAEAAEEREREIQQREMNDKYAKWGKGLKQVEDHEEKIKNDLYEMNKPLARYADDADLDKQLREQEREGDPMLAYIKEKQIKEGKKKADPPKYEGSFAPNRFGIRPGRRWDGVDRSNGYENKWFEAQNEKMARHEEAYKWSTSDM